MIFTHLILIAIGFLPSFSFASDCTRIDNAASLGPARNQDSVGWCYAFASAELVGHKIDQRISPTDIAISSNFMRPRTLTESLREYIHGTAYPLEGGEVSDTINQIQSLTQGFCPEDEIPETAHLGQALEQARRRHQCLSGQREACEYENFGALALMPLLSPSEADAGLKDPMTPKAWFKLAEKACKHRVKLPNGTRAVQLSGSNRSSRESLLEVVDQQLEAGNILAMQYDQMQIDSFPWWAQINVAMDRVAGTLARSVGLPDDPSHAVAIVGRRYNTELRSCQYEIRDSDNFKCKYGDATICDTDNRIWYTREAITRHIHDLIYLSE